MILPATKPDLVVQKGADFSFSFDILVGGASMDLTGAVVESQIRAREARQAEKVADFTVSIEDATVITLSLTAAQTAAITQTSGFYDVALTSNGKTEYYLRAKVRFQPTITVPA